jgi:crotonobetaine/carnitine-CoA ligase
MRLHGETLEAGTLGALVRLRAARLGTKPLLLLRGETLTYEDADRRSDALARGLQHLGARKGTRVATLAYNSVDQVCVWFACAKLGAVWIPLNVSLGPDDLRYSLDDAEAEVVFVDAELSDTYVALRGSLARPPLEILCGPRADAEGLSMGCFDDVPDAEGPLSPEEPVAPSDPLAIVYTGGSTGMPKGVLVPHLYYLAAAMRFRDIAQVAPGDVMYESGHLFHSGGQQLGVSGPLFCGITSAMTKWFSVSRFWDVVRDADASVIHVPGTMIGPILDRTPPSDGDLAHRVRVGVGTGTGQIRREIRDEFERRFGVVLLEVYAQTELGVLMCSQRIDDRPAGSSGHTDGWAEIRIADEHDQALPVGEVGQILIRPSEAYTSMLEYVGKERETLRCWRNLWYHTGDRGRLDEQGRLYFAGREAFWLRRRGENVSSHEVERALGSHPSVEDCAVVGVPGDLGDEEIKAYVQLRPAANVEPQALVDWCRERIAYFKCPRYIEFVGGFPRTASKGDIERQKLRAAGIGDAWDAEAQAASRS